MRGRNDPGTRLPAGGGAGGNGGRNGSGPTVVGSLAEFGNDIATLVELQAKLAELDTKDCLERAILPVVAIGAGAVVILGALPVAMLGVADLLVSFLGIGPGWAKLLTAALVMVVAAVIAFVSLREFRRSLEPFRRSREELIRNLSWIRTVLVHSGRTSSRRAP